MSMIPHTMEHTNFASKKIGDRVNLENDMVGKYVEKLLQTRRNRKKRLQGLRWKLCFVQGFRRETET